MTAVLSACCRIIKATTSKPWNTKGRANTACHSLSFELHAFPSQSSRTTASCAVTPRHANIEPPQTRPRRRPSAFPSCADNMLLDALPCKCCHRGQKKHNTTASRIVYCTRLFVCDSSPGRQHSSVNG